MIIPKHKNYYQHRQSLFKQSASTHNKFSNIRFPSQLFSGLYYPLITVPLVNSIVFGSYEFFKLLKNKQQLSFGEGIENGAFAGLVNSIVVGPVELIKCQMQVSGNDTITSRECMKAIIRSQGIIGLFRGLNSTVFRQVPAYAAQFAAYEQLKSMCIKYNNSIVNISNPQTLPNDELSLIQSMVVGSMAGLSCWIFSYPQDVIKTKIQLQGTNNTNQSKLTAKYRSIYQVGSQIYKNHGYYGFWVGFTPCAIRAVVANGIGIAAYQKCSSYLKKCRKDNN